MTYDQKKVDFFSVISDSIDVGRAGNGKLTNGLRSTTRRFMSLRSKGETGPRKSGLKVALVAVICFGLGRLDQVGKGAGKGLALTSPFFISRNFRGRMPLNFPSLRKMAGTGLEQGLLALKN